MERFAIANLVGGTIVIPHTRRARNTGKRLKKQGADDRVNQRLCILVIERLYAEGHEKET
jgi:hypothetical protein